MGVVFARTVTTYQYSHFDGSSTTIVDNRNKVLPAIVGDTATSTSAGSA
jgi:hypothetical protein